MKQFHSLPEPEALGFKWTAFKKALERVHNVERRRREAERKAAELQGRIRQENEQDIQRLADAIRQGKPDTAPPGLEDLDAALEEAIEAEREAYARAQKMTSQARSKRQHLEELAKWVRTTPPVFSPPADVSVPSAFGQLSQDADRAERQMLERIEYEREQLEENARREALEEATA